MAVDPSDIAGPSTATSSVPILPKGLRIKDLLLQIYNQRNAYNQQAAPFFGMEQRRGEFGQGFFPQLKGAIENPQASPAFKLYLNEGLDALRSKYAVTGSPSGGPGQIAGGRFAAGLAGQAYDTQQQQLMQAAMGFRGLLPRTQEPEYFGAAVGGQNARANLLNALASINNSQASQTQGSSFGLF